MKIKEWLLNLWNKMSRTTRKDLREEIMKVKDELDSAKPGTVKYKNINEEYKALLDKEIKLIEFDKNITKASVATILSIIGIFIWDYKSKHADDPFTREIVNKFIRLFGGGH